MSNDKNNGSKEEAWRTVLEGINQRSLGQGESTRGGKGELGEATPALTIKQKWVASGKHVSLKQFARQLLADGDKDVKAWFANKRGACNQKRTDANLSRASLERQASRAARRKKSEGKKNKAAAEAAAPAAK